MSIEIRAARDGDRTPVTALAPRLAEGIAPWREREAVVRAAEGWLADSFAAAARGDGSVFVADAGSEIVGVVTVGERRHFTGVLDGYVGELVVAAWVARCGVGTMLMAAAEEWARQRGLRRLTLHTGMSNVPARRFYDALGYQGEDVQLTRAL